MPNYCEYQMKITGSKSAIKRVIKCLNENYDYNKGVKPNKHFFRVFDVNDDDEMVANENGTFTQLVWGYCAWSVHSCMCEGKGTYYSDVKSSFPNTFNGTTLRKQSRNCRIEVFSEEPGVGFSEHYIFDNGVCLCDDCEQIEVGGYDENGNPTTDIDWETYDGDQIVFNPFRIGTNEDFDWAD